MFEEFRAHFRYDAFSLASLQAVPQESVSTESSVASLLQCFAGVSFDSGLYRVMSPRVLELAKEFIAVAFPALLERSSPFGFDWLGNIFALDLERQIDGAPLVILLEPGFGRSLKIPANLATFHNQEIIKNADAALAFGFHRQWLASGGSVPRFDQCVGYRIPLFLGGKDQLDNLEISDLDVYWTLSAQIMRQSTRKK